MARKTRSSLLLKIVSLALLALAVYSIVVTIISFVKLDNFSEIGAAVVGNVVRIIMILVTFAAGWFGFTARKKALCYLLLAILVVLAVYSLVVDLITCSSISSVIAVLISDILFIVLPVLYFFGLRKSA